MPHRDFDAHDQRGDTGPADEESWPDRGGDGSGDEESDTHQEG